MFDTIRYTPRYIRNSDAFGWQGADNPNGPWRSISPPESGTPFQITNPMGDLRQASADVSGVKVLSPAAQAVLDAFLGDAENTGLQMDDLRENVAAALRAAADLERSNPWGARIECAGAMWMRDQLLAIASELAGAQPPNLTH